MTDFVTRFAPSPTGYLHLGHAFSALTAFRAAREAGGRFLLRIEDIDRGRRRPEFETAIYEDLAWLGLEWETPVRRQSDHFADYEAALSRLIDKGLVYRCFKTRKEVLDEIARAPHLGREGPEGPAFIGAALPEAEESVLIIASAPFAWRLSMARTRKSLGPHFDRLSFIEQDIDGANERRVPATPEIFGDAVIARKDSGTSYHLASVHDDALAGVTHVIRGDDLRAAAHLHALLQALLESPAPVYRHHELIADDSGKRLAKRDKAATLRSLRDAGATPADLYRRLGFSD
ncbi:MAG TPA: tRNA glutamyl-Q(34) synthetase GluQRS [Parvularculaceae bacterium]|nr:tRNA glutamyl-Q(34) synthetase GluQRS [Parvularculaceae bacterium]